jgi:hypothetical protein
VTQQKQEPLADKLNARLLRIQYALNTLLLLLAYHHQTYQELLPNHQDAHPSQPVMPAKKEPIADKLNARLFQAKPALNMPLLLHALTVDLLREQDAHPSQPVMPAKKEPTADKLNARLFQAKPALNTPLLPHALMVFTKLIADHSQPVMPTKKEPTADKLNAKLLLQVYAHPTPLPPLAQFKLLEQDLPNREQKVL